MTIEVIFNPLQKIQVFNESNELIRKIPLPNCMRFQELPEFFWAIYQPTQAQHFETRKVMFVDSHTQKTVPLWIRPREICSPLFWGTYSSFVDRYDVQHVDDLNEKIIELIDCFKKTLKELQIIYRYVFKKEPSTKLEEVALQMARVSTFAYRESFLSFPLHAYKLPIHNYTFSPEGFIFVELSAQPIAKGAKRVFEKVIWSNHSYPAEVAKGSVSASRAQFAKEKDILSRLNGTKGIIKTFTCGQTLPITEIGQDLETIFIQELHQTDLFYWLTEKRISLLPQDKMDLFEQLLHGLNAISTLGSHGDLNFNNIVFRRTHTGAIKGAIIDFESFTSKNS